MVRRHAARSLMGVVAVLASSTLAAACVPPPPPGPPAPPTPPVITRFTADSARTEAPVVATLGWTINDPNSEPLTCRVDTDGDGQFDRVVEACNSGSLVLASFDTAGTRTLTLEVSDGIFPPVTSTADLAVSAGPSETYQISLRLDPNMRPEFREAFEAAAQRWEEVIVAGVSDQYLGLPINPFGFPPFEGWVDDILIDARDTAMDGPGNVLGRAGAFAVREGDFQPYYGIMEFDTDDLEMMQTKGILHSVILHEMGHVLGLGPSWLLTGRIVDPFFNPRYNGPAANAVYQDLGGSGLIPLESEGGIGTVLVHWNEAVFGDELMTGYIGSGPAALSRMTIGALADQGYGVDLSAADPYSLPGSPHAVEDREDIDVRNEGAVDLTVEAVRPGLFSPPAAGGRPDGG